MNFQHLTSSLAIHLIQIVAFDMEVCCPLVRDTANIANLWENQLNLHDRSTWIAWGNQNFARLPKAISTPSGIHHHLMEHAVCVCSSNPHLQQPTLPQQEFPEDQEYLVIKWTNGKDREITGPGIYLLSFFLFFVPCKRFVSWCFIVCIFGVFGCYSQGVTLSVNEFHSVNMWREGKW